MTKGLAIRNAVIVDGTGSEPFCGSVLVADGRILEVGQIEPPEGYAVLDAAGRCLTPGFIDIHRHADLQALTPDFGAAELMQGITSCVSGNCGMSAAPCPPGQKDLLYSYLEPCLGVAPEKAGFPAFADYAARLRAAPLRLNMGTLVGNGAVRIAAKGFDPSAMTAEEMDRAKACISEAMDAGALGMSLGLMYAPECNYSADELVELAGVVARRGGVITTHIRGEGASLPQSIGEVIDIAAQAGARLHISHFKAAGRSSWGDGLRRAIGQIETARAKGQDITCDVYPYSAGSTMLLTLLPPRFLAGGVSEALDALERTETRDRLREELSRPHDGWDNLALDLGWDRIVVSSAAHRDNAGIIGHSIADIARKRGCSEVDCLCEILGSEEGRAGMVLHCMSPDDVAAVMALPYSMVVSDAIYPPSGYPHPRLFGAFPRVIREFVLEKGVLSLPEAIRKMTAMPAWRVGLKGLGLVKAGYRADLLLFDPQRLRDRATYEDPMQLSQGIDFAFVNGRIVIGNGVLSNERHGAFLERQDMA